MTALTQPSGQILIASDNSTDAESVRCLTADKFTNIRISTNPQRAVQDFDAVPTDILILAFKTLEAAERYYLGLFRLSTRIHAQPHRTVVLCGTADLKRVSELCMNKHFDDYVLFWPLNHDAPRLPMAIHLGLRELSVLHRGAPTVAEFAAQARRLQELEALLGQATTKGVSKAADIEHALKTAGTDIQGTLQGMTRRLTEGDLSAMVEVKDSAQLKHQFTRMYDENIARTLQATSESVQNLKQWAGGLKGEVAPHLETVKAMGAMAEKVRPLVLIVDDDQFLKNVLSKVLMAGHYEVATSSSGSEAMALLRTLRPDIVLMDIGLPGMDGIETTRKLKGIAHLARLPVIMLTGMSDAGSVLESRKAGAVDFITKPIVKETLLQKVARALGMSKPLPG